MPNCSESDAMLRILLIVSEMHDIGMETFVVETFHYLRGPWAPEHNKNGEDHRNISSKGLPLLQR